MKCEICGAPVEPRPVSFPARKPPYNELFLAPLYFADPFFHGGEMVPFCGAECSARWWQKEAS